MTHRPRMPLVQVVYRALLRGFRVLSPTMMWGSSKLALGLRGRRDAHRTLVDWGLHRRDSNRPVVWFHASSVGEGLQAKVVLEALKTRSPDLQVVFTFFSPSAQTLAERFPADVATYLPWDLPEVVGEVFDAVCPDLMVFTQKEVWPSVAAAAEDRGVPVALVAGTLAGATGRLSPMGKALLRQAFRSLARVAAISAADGERFRGLEVAAERIVVTGDPGVDYASGRAAAADPATAHLQLFRDAPGPVLVAGSTWRSDEEVLLPGLARVRRDWPGLRVVLAPHEPEGWDLDGLATRLSSDGWSPVLLRDAEGLLGLDGADVVLVERVGVLAELYTVASIAYVGGGFHGKGLHSVLEPAAAGVPVLFGPHHQNSLAAFDLLACGGAMVVGGADGLANVLRDLLGDADKLEDHGGRARNYIAEHRGAASRTADLLVDCLTEQA